MRIFFWLFTKIIFRIKIAYLQIYFSNLNNVFIDHKICANFLNRKNLLIPKFFSWINKKKYAYYLIRKKFVNKKKYLVYFLECITLYTAAILCSYTVMQSDGNSFDGEVVSGIFNKTFRDEDNNLDQIHKSKYAWIIFVVILIHYNIIPKCILTQQ